MEVDPTTQRTNDYDKDPDSMDTSLDPPLSHGPKTQGPDCASDAGMAAQTEPTPVLERPREDSDTSKMSQQPGKTPYMGVSHTFFVESVLT